MSVEGGASMLSSASVRTVPPSRGGHSEVACWYPSPRGLIHHTYLISPAEVMVRVRARSQIQTILPQGRSHPRQPQALATECGSLVPSTRDADTSSSVDVSWWGAPAWPT